MCYTKTTSRIVFIKMDKISDIKKTFWVIVFISITIKAQEQFNFKADHYSGINGALLDPTHNLSNPNNWDVNLLGVDVFVQNDYSYISEASILSLLLKADLEIAQPTNGITGATRNRTWDFYSTSGNKDAYVQADIMGPSGSIRLNYHHTIGLFTRARVVASARNIDEGFNYYNFHEINFGTPFSADKSDLQGAAWAEVGLNYAKVLKESKTHKLSAGVNLKYLIGTDAAYAINHRRGRAVAQQDTITFTNADFEIGVVTGAEMYDEATAGEYNLKKKGSGLGLDIGVSWEKKRYPTDILIDTDVTYKWKMNATLLDLGQIRYKNAEVHRYTIEGSQLIDFNQAESTETIEQYFQDLSTQVYNDSLQSKIGNEFVVGLPTALNLNFDYGLSDRWYIKTNLIQRIPVFENALKRSNVLNVNGRYQKNWFGISGGITAYEYQNVYLGGSVRIGPLTLGSDHFIPIIMPQKELTGADFYFALKINSFWDDLWKRHKRCNCPKF